jgi:hypothetical protein
MVATSLIGEFDDLGFERPRVMPKLFARQVANISLLAQKVGIVDSRAPPDRGPPYGPDNASCKASAC